jgi:hypothetical protein
MAGQEPETATSRARLTLSAIVDTVLRKEGIRNSTRTFVEAATGYASQWMR